MFFTGRLLTLYLFYGLIGYQKQEEIDMARKIISVARGARVELAPIRPSAAIRAAYQKRLEAAVGEMDRSINYWITARYRAELPRIAMDAIPARELRAALRKLGRRWRAKFDTLSVDLADYFARASSQRIDGELARMLKRAGFTVQFRMSAQQRDAYAAVVEQNVALIRSVAVRHLEAVEGVVMRSVAAGHDRGMLSKALQENYGVTKRRAALIARTQVSMANATLVKSRQQELGVTKAKWLHSAGGRVPRPEHVAFSGKLYDVSKGAFLEGKWTYPGLEIGCRCVSISIIEGV
jgi:SPP1 gp7 family putative phage head morphogenesis protein